MSAIRSASKVPEEYYKEVQTIPGDPAFASKVESTLTFPVAARGRPRKSPVPDVTSLSAEKTLASAPWCSLSWRLVVRPKQMVPICLDKWAHQLRRRNN